MGEFNFKTLASSGPSPEQLKEPVDKAHPRELISYNRKVYAIRYLELRNLGLDYHDEIVTMCRERGLEDPAFFGRACMYCANSTTNIEDLVGQDDKIVILSGMPKTNCTYHPDKDISAAITFFFKRWKTETFLCN